MLDGETVYVLPTCAPGFQVNVPEPLALKTVLVPLQIVEPLELVMVGLGAGFILIETVFEAPVAAWQLPSTEDKVNVTVPDSPAPGEYVVVTV